MGEEALWRVVVVLATLTSLVAGLVTLIESDAVVSMFRSETEFEEFWRPIVDGYEVVLVLPGTSIDLLRENKRVIDDKGAIELVDALREAFDDTDITVVRASEFEQAHHNANIVSIAGPDPNSFAREILYSPTAEYTFDRLSTGQITAKVVGTNRRESFARTPVTENDGKEFRVKRDYGIITRFESPYDPHSVVVNIAGGFGEGTLAGTRLLRQRGALAFLNRRDDSEFQVVYTTEVDDSGQLMRSYLLDRHPNREISEDTYVTLNSDVC